MASGHPHKSNKTGGQYSWKSILTETKLEGLKAKARENPQFKEQV